MSELAPRNFIELLMHGEQGALEQHFVEAMLPVKEPTGARKNGGRDAS